MLIVCLKVAMRYPDLNAPVALSMFTPLLQRLYQPRGVLGDKGATGVETRHASQPFRLQVILREPACFAPLEEKIITIIAIARLPRLIPSGVFAW